MISFLEERVAGDVFDGVRAALRGDRGRGRRAGADYLTYLLVDAVIDHYFVVLEQLGAVDLTLVWRGSLLVRGPTGPLGALAEVAAEPLPFAPERLQIEALGRAAKGRPVPLRLTVPGADGPLRGELRVRAPNGALWREAIALAGGLPLEVAFVPSVVGDHEVELALAVGGVTVRATGALAVAGPPAVLVLEPSGAIAARTR